MLQIIKETKENFDKFCGLNGIKAYYGRTLIARNTGDVLLFSNKDWLAIRSCQWNLTKNGGIVNQRGVSFEKYVGIVTRRRSDATHKFDFSRYNYY